MNNKSFEEKCIGSVEMEEARQAIKSKRSRSRIPVQSDDGDGMINSEFMRNLSMVMNNESKSIPEEVDIFIDKLYGKIYEEDEYVQNVLAVMKGIFDLSQYINGNLTELYTEKSIKELEKLEINTTEFAEGEEQSRKVEDILFDLCLSATDTPEDAVLLRNIMSSCIHKVD